MNFLCDDRDGNTVLRQSSFQTLASILSARFRDRSFLSLNSLHYVHNAAQFTGITNAANVVYPSQDDPPGNTKEMSQILK